MSRFYTPEQTDPGSYEWACGRSVFDDLYDFARASAAASAGMTEAEERASYDRFHGEGAWDRLTAKAEAERAAKHADMIARFDADHGAGAYDAMQQRGEAALAERKARIRAAMALRTAQFEARMSHYGKDAA